MIEFWLYTEGFNRKKSAVVEIFEKKVEKMNQLKLYLVNNNYSLPIIKILHLIT